MSLSDTVPPQAIEMAVFFFGRCELRVGTRELLVDGLPQAIRRRVFDLMLYLIAHRTRVVPHDELLHEVWPRPHVSTKMLSRAVMEARHACGDTAEQAELFASVHGVGYRFVGQLKEVSGGAAVGRPPPEAGAQGVLALLDLAKAARDAGQLDEAQLLAERALIQAGESPSQSARVQALVLCSGLALLRGTAELAAKRAAQALQVARAEGRTQLEAQARLALGCVHVVAGDGTLALRYLQEAREVLRVTGPQEDLLSCNNHIAAAFREMGNAETGLRMCRENLSYAIRVHAVRHILAERGNEIGFLLRLGEQQAADGHAARAQATFEEGLARSDVLLRDIDAQGAVARRQSALGNRLCLLEKLGRVDEAWRVLAELDKARQPSGLAGTPLHADHLQLIRMLRASLLARAGRDAEALQDIQHGIDMARSCSTGAALPRLYGMASEMAERAGCGDLALAYARQHSAALVARHASDSAALVRILEAEHNIEELQADLQRSRKQVSELLRENAEIRQQAQAMAGTLPVSPLTGTAPEDCLTAAFHGAFRRAKTRGLPMCLGLLSLNDALLLRFAQAPELLQAFVKRAAGVLRSHADIAYPAVAVGVAQLVFHIRDVGLTSAAEVCLALREQLQRQDWSPAQPASQVVWRIELLDGTELASVDAAVHQLRSRPAMLNEGLMSRLASPDVDQAL